MKKKSPENKLMTLELDQENLGLITKYQGEFHSNMNRKISRHEVINLALTFFLNLQHEWPIKDKQ